MSRNNRNQSSPETLSCAVLFPREQLLERRVRSLSRRCHRRRSAQAKVFDLHERLHVLRFEECGFRKTATYPGKLEQRPAHAKSVERHGMPVPIVRRGFLGDALPGRYLLHLAGR